MIGGQSVTYLADSYLAERGGSCKSSTQGPAHCIKERDFLHITLELLQELQGDARFLQVTNDDIQLILAERAAEVSEHFNVLLPKLLPSKRQSGHIRKHSLRARETAQQTRTAALKAWSLSSVTRTYTG